jgi:hypothetical protein
MREVSRFCFGIYKRPSRQLVSYVLIVSKMLMLLTRRFVRDPGCDGSLLILLRLISNISRQGITVNCDQTKSESNSSCVRIWKRTTSGKTEKLLLFKLRYRNRDNSANAIGRAAKRLFPSASLSNPGPEVKANCDDTVRRTAGQCTRLPRYPPYQR